MVVMYLMLIIAVLLTEKTLGCYVFDVNSSCIAKFVELMQPVVIISKHGRKCF